MHFDTFSNKLRQEAIMYVLVALIAMMLLNLTGAYAEIPRAITASGWQEPNRPQNSVDHRGETRWSCQGTCWIKYDFGKIIYVSDIWLFWRNIEKRSQAFSIETSVDGSTWEVSFSGKTEIPTDGSNYPFGHYVDTDLRFVRIVATGNSFNDWNSLNEAEFVQPFSESEDYTFIPWSESVTASNSLDGNLPQKAEDGNLSTFWTGGAGDYVEFELDDIYAIHHVEIAWMNGHTRVQQYAIDISVDGSDWERIIEDASTGKTKDFETNLFPGPQPAKFVRIVNNGGNNSSTPASKVKISITEVYIYASLSGSL
jgi:F5/8 type C domain